MSFLNLEMLVYLGCMNLQFTNDYDLMVLSQVIHVCVYITWHALSL